jgi:hypothetical protein
MAADDGYYWNNQIYRRPLPVYRIGLIIQITGGNSNGCSNDFPGSERGR